MNTRTSQLLIALLMTVFFASCSRPVAYFQKTQRESFATKKTETPVTPVAALEPITEQAPVAPTTANATADVAAPANELKEATAALDQLDAVVRNDNKLANNRSVQKRLERVRTMLTAPGQSEKLAAASTSPRKANLIERAMLKKMDKKIKNHLAPEKPMAKSLLTIGLIIGIIGLLLIVLGVGSPLGIIALVAGLILILVDLLQ